MELKTSLRFIDHVNEALTIEPAETVAYVALQGSQNYGLQYENSDVDTKAIVTPTLMSIVKNQKMKSYTHVRTNDEHIDVKSVAPMFDCFRKQNINFIEILFTDYFWINDLYKDEIQALRDSAEEIARMDTYQAVKCMKGMVYEKYHALEHPYPAKAQIIAEHGYDGKQLSHMVRIEKFLKKYVDGELYKNCLKSNQRDWLIYLKQHKLTLKEARELAEETLKKVETIADVFCAFNENRETYKNQRTFELLDEIQYDLIHKALVNELQQER